MRFFAFVLAAAVFTGEAVASEDPPTDSETWNRAVDLYREGNATNALAALKPLLLSKTHGARAAELVAKLEYDAARKPGAPDALKHLEEAAYAAQIALRANPDDKRANDNFTRATDGLAELRESKRIDAVLEAAKKKDPAAMLGDAVREIRAIASEAATYKTNAARVAISRADALSSRASRLADTWLCVKELVCSSVTNAEDAATISSRVDAARTKTGEIAEMLGDMEEGASYKIAEVEQDFTDFFKMAVLPPQAIRIDLAAQSNAWMDVEAEYGRPWQNEALDYTRAFRAKFPAWADAYSVQAQSDTNKPPFTAEARKEVETLSARLEELQTMCAKEPLPPQQEESVGIIKRIIELLPQDKGGGGSGGAGQGSQKNNPKDGKNDKDKQDQEGKEGEDPGVAPENQEEPPKNDDDGDRQSAGDDRKDSKSQDEREIEAVLKKAQERNDEHEARKKERQRKAPMPPNERDW